jgi:prevent-host-death family protein
MKTASVSELKSRLSEFLRQVRGGDSVMVLDRGRPVALLGPYRGADSELAELRDAGLVRLGSGQIPADYWTQPLAEDPEGLVLTALLEEREEGW